MWKFGGHLSILSVLILCISASHRDTGDDLYGLKESVDVDFSINNMFTFDRTAGHDTKDVSLYSNHLKELGNENFQLNQPMAFEAFGRCQQNYDLLHNEIRIYILRYINLFLRSSDLKERELERSGKRELKLDLEFSITPENLLFLQNWSKNVEGMKIQDQLNKIDSILVGGFHVKSDDLLVYILSFIRNILSTINFGSLFTCLSSKEFYYSVFIFFTLLMFYSLKFYQTTKRFLFLIVLNNWIFLEGLLNYNQKLKEAETIDIVKKLQLGEYPDDCDPKKRSFWATLFSWFWTNNCLEYYKTMSLKTADKISPLEAILQSYSSYLFEYPFKILGNCIRVFAESVSEFSPGWLRYITTSSVIVVSAIFLLTVIVCTMKPWIRLGLFGASLELGFFNGEPNRGARLPARLDEGRMLSGHIQDLTESESDAISRAKISSMHVCNQLKENEGETSEPGRTTENKCRKISVSDGDPKPINDNSQRIVESAPPKEVGEDARDDS